MPQFLNGVLPATWRPAQKAGISAHRRAPTAPLTIGGLQAWTSSMFIAGAITGERFVLAMSSVQPFDMCRTGTQYMSLLPHDMLPELERSLPKVFSHSLIHDGSDAALAVAFFPKFFQRLGRKYTMMIGAGCFLVGAALQACSFPSYGHCRQSVFSRDAVACHLKPRHHAEVRGGDLNICIPAY